MKHPKRRTPGPIPKPKPGKNTDFADRMKRWRDLHGYTQDEAASVFEIPVKSWQNWEESRTTPRLMAAQKLLDRFSCDRVS